MRIKIFHTVLTVLIVLFFTNVFGQDIKKSGITDAEKKVEAYIIKLTKPKFYYAMQFEDKEDFDYEKLNKDLRVPKIFSDDSEAIDMNENAFNRLKTYSKETNIKYSMTIIFGLKENENDVWDSNWTLVLLDDNLNVLNHFFYAP